MKSTRREMLTVGGRTLLAAAVGRSGLEFGSEEGPKDLAKWKFSQPLRVPPILSPVRIEDRESALGHPLNEDELAEILKKHGHPLVVATRYRQTRHLIGSTLFPVYWFVMKMILAAVGFGYAVSALVLIAQGKSLPEAFGSIFSYIGAVLPTFGWVTIIFAVLDIGNNRFHFLEKVTKNANEKFDPRSLPALRPASDHPDAKPIPRSKSAFELFFSAAFLLWWIRVSPIRKLALFMVLGARARIADGAEFAETLRIVNKTLHYTMIFTAILTAVECVKQIRRLFRLGRTPATAASTMV